MSGKGAVAPATFVPLSPQAALEAVASWSASRLSLLTFGLK